MPARKPQHYKPICLKTSGRHSLSSPAMIAAELIYIRQLTGFIIVKYVNRINSTLFHFYHDLSRRIKIYIYNFQLQHGIVYQMKVPVSDIAPVHDRTQSLRFQNTQNNLTSQRNN